MIGDEKEMEKYRQKYRKSIREKVGTKERITDVHKDRKEASPEE